MAMPHFADLILAFFLNYLQLGLKLSSHDLNVGLMLLFHLFDFLLMALALSMQEEVSPSFLKRQFFLL